MIIEYHAGVPDRQFLFYTLDTLYAGGAAGGDMSLHGLGTVAGCALDTSFLDSLFTPSPEPHCQAGDLLASPSIAPQTVVGVTPLPASYRSLTVVNQNIGTVRFSP